MKLLNKFSLLLCVFFLIGADSPTLVSYPNQRIMGFRGLDTSSSAPMLEDGRATEMLNVSLSRAFDLRKRYGYKVVSATLDDLWLESPAVSGIFDSYFSNGTSKTIAYVGDKLKYDNGSSWTDIAGTGAITSGANNQWNCIMALDYAVCTDDVDAPMKISSTPERSALSFTGLSSAVAKAKQFVWFRNYLIALNTVEGGVESPTRFRWSNVGTIETWSDEDYVDISTYGGDEILGAVELYGDLYVFLKKSIWAISLVGGDDVFSITKVIDGIGAVARDTIQLVQLSQNRVVAILLDEKKRVLLFDGASVSDIGAVIQPTLDGMSDTRLPYAVGTFDGSHYYLSMTSSGEATNDTVFDLQTEIMEWAKHDQIDANVFAQVTDSNSESKTYFGNYAGFVYEMNNSDQKNDIDGATGVVDSVGTVSTLTITGAQVLIDSGLTAGVYTGAIVKITSGTAAGEEAVILSSDDTSLVVTSPFSTTPDETSVYSIGAIDAKYKTKWYDLGDSAREKTFLGMLFWAEENSNNAVTVGHYIDFNDYGGTEEKALAPSSSSLWDVALWDVGTWGVTGDKIYTVKTKGFGNHVRYSFENNDPDESFHLYGFNVIATVGDIKQ